MISEEEQCHQPFFVGLALLHLHVWAPQDVVQAACLRGIKAFKPLC